MKTYADIIELLNFEGPGLQDYVTADELDQLIDGTLAPAVIADRYLEDLRDTKHAAVDTDENTTRADLLSWIRWEIVIAVDQREQAARDDAMCTKLTEIDVTVSAEKRFIWRIHQHKLDLARQALRLGATKADVAATLGTSRPTLDKWLTS